MAHGTVTLPLQRGALRHRFHDQEQVVGPYVRDWSQAINISGISRKCRVEYNWKGHFPTIDDVHWFTVRFDEWKSGTLLASEKIGSLKITSASSSKSDTALSTLHKSYFFIIKTILLDRCLKTGGLNCLSPLVASLSPLAVATGKKE